MKCAAVRVLCSSLLLSGASLIHAQSPDPPNVVRIFREDIKSGKNVAHQKVESGYAHAFAKNGYPSYIGLVNLTGTSQAWFIESYDSHESIGKAIHLSDTEPLKSAIAPLDVQDGELRTGERNMIAAYQKGLSYLPVPSNLPKARFVQINTIRVRVGHAPEFAEMRNLLNAAMQKGGNKQRRVIYLVTSGAPSGTYLVLRPMESLKALDPEASAMSINDAYGPENLARYEKLESEAVVSIESTLFSVDPTMSNPSKEFIAADPDFWAPKPKPIAAKSAAKPAGSP